MMPLWFRLVVIPSLVLGWSCSSFPAWAKLRISAGAVVQADELTVRQIEDAFNRAAEAIENEDLDALMRIYSRNYRYQHYTKKDMWNIWREFFAQYDRISTLHAFSRIVVKPGTPPTADIVCTGSLWATSSRTQQRVNLASWLANTHHLVYEDGEWRILGQGTKAPEPSTFAKVPPPLF